MDIQPEYCNKEDADDNPERFHYSPCLTVTPGHLCGHLFWLLFTLCPYVFPYVRKGFDCRGHGDTLKTTYILLFFRIFIIKDTSPYTFSYTLFLRCPCAHQWQFRCCIRENDGHNSKVALKYCPPLQFYGASPGVKGLISYSVKRPEWTSPVLGLRYSPRGLRPVCLTPKRFKA